MFDTKKHTLLFWLGMIGYVVPAMLLFGCILFILLTTVILALAVYLWLAI